MLRRKVKKMLSLTLSAAMVVGTLGSSQVVNAAELQNESKEVSPLWETIDEELEAFEEISDVQDVEEANEVAPEYADDENVRVFIVFDEEGVVDAGYAPEDVATSKAAKNYADKLENEQNEIIEVIEEEALNGESLDTRYSFTLLTNAVSADVAYGQIADIEAVDGVSAVYVTPVYEIQKTPDTSNPNTMTSGEMVGSYQTWTAGYTGAGRRIAVIDTGLDTDHPSFDAGAFMYSLEEVAAELGKTVDDYKLLNVSEISGKLASLNASKRYARLTAEKVYLNEKVPFAFNYVDKDLDVTHDHDSQGDHGTHVSGISTANKYVPSAEGYVAQKSGVVGIAPDAQLLTMKVFGKGGGAYPDDYMAAIEDALVLGADTINLSLGSSSAGESVAAEEYLNTVMNKLFGTDTVVSISAGNAYYWSHDSQMGLNYATDVNADTVGSPGSYTNAFTVASAINSGYTANALRIEDQYNAFYSDGSSANNAPFASLDKTGKGVEYGYVLFDGFGNPEDFKGVDCKGKIVFVSRGEISFYQKHDNGAAAGAAGVIVYNNQAGTIGMNLTGSTSRIPCASIKQADAEAIRKISAYDEAKGIYTGTLLVSNTVLTDHNVSDGYLMSDFSSWGVPGDLALKPEITAPGGNIYSTLTNGQYGLMSGTSMAAPSVAGITALVLQYIEENDLAAKTGLSARTLAQSLLMSTASQLTEEDGSDYSPRKQGAGLANANAATTTPAYILVGDKATNDGKVKVELGDDPQRSGEYSFDFTVYNMSDKTVYYDLGATLLTESAASDDERYYVLNNSLELSTTPVVTASSTELLFDLNKDKKINKTDAKILLQYVNKSTTSDKIDICQDDFDFDGNGVVDTNDVTLFQNAINKKNQNIDLKKEVLAVNDQADVNVSIKLNKDDKEYLNKVFTNGMFVEGFAKLDGKVDLSVPFMGFFGNWTDSSMFEAYNYLENPKAETYTGVEKTNYLTYQFPGDTAKYIFPGNFYAEDEQYVADRNALASGQGIAIAGATYTLIRNAASVDATVTNAEDGTVYFKTSKGAATGAYYSSSQSQWNNTSSSVVYNWAVTDENGNALPEGTKVNVSVTALPAYYNDSTKTPGKGASFTVPFTIDNTAPEVVALEEEDGKMTLTVKDNEYAAAVLVIGSNKRDIIGRYAVNQYVKGEEKSVTFEYPESIFYVRVYDYAGNAITGRINMSGKPDTTVPETLELSETSVTLLKGNQMMLEATVGPETLLEEYAGVVWTSEDETIATVDEDGIITAVNEGTTKIIATTAEVNAEGVALTAECEVNVITLSVELHSTLWDEEGQVYFSKFETNKLPKYEKLSDAMAPSFWSAAVVGDKLLASTYNTSQSAADYYLVDPNKDYAVEKVGTNVWSTDLAYGYLTDVVLGSYAYYVNVMETNGDFLGQLDLSKYTGGEYLVGITYFGIMNLGVYVDTFIAVDRAGNVYLVYLTSDFRYGVAQLGNIGISTNGMWYYESLYYDFDSDMIYYSVYDKSDEVTLYAIDMNGEEPVAYELGQFSSGVWPISGLYQWTDLDKNTATAKNVIDIDVDSFEKMSTSISDKTFATESIREVADADEAEEVVAEEEIVEDEIVEEEIAEDEEIIDEDAIVEETNDEEADAVVEEEDETEEEEESKEAATEEDLDEEAGEDRDVFEASI